MEEGDEASFLFNGLGLCPGAKLVSTNDRPPYSLILFRLFPSGGEKKKLRGVLHEPVGGTSRHVCMSVEIFGQKMEDLTCLCSTLSRI